MMSEWEGRVDEISADTVYATMFSYKDRWKISALEIPKLKFSKEDQLLLASGVMFHLGVFGPSITLHLLRKDEPLCLPSFCSRCAALLTQQCLTTDPS